MPACALLLAFTAAPIHAQHYQDLDEFGCATGCTPYGRLAQGANGNLYGTTESGGSNNLGTIFMVFMMTTAGAIKKLYTFLDESDGATPNAPLTQGKDGNLSGSADNGGNYLECDRHK